MFHLLPASFSHLFSFLVLKLITLWSVKKYFFTSCFVCIYVGFSFHHWRRRKEMIFFTIFSITRGWKVVRVKLLSLARKTTQPHSLTRSSWWFYVLQTVENRKNHTKQICHNELCYTRNKKMRGRNCGIAGDWGELVMNFRVDLIKITSMQSISGH